MSEARSFFEHHQLPIPEHREILQETLTQVFDDPMHYLDGIDPPVSPFGLLGGDARRWTHEVQIVDHMDVKGHDHDLEAVFIHNQRIGDERAVEYLTWCEDNGVPVEYVRVPSGASGGLQAFNALRNAARDYIRNMLS